MRSLITASIAVVFALLILPARADEAPWGKVDLKAAAELHEKACTGCHSRMYGKDGSQMYTRDGRQLSTKLELQKRVAACNASVNAGWFPEEENSVAAWLNKHYYKFEN
jgi:hypothetical protein